MQEYAFLHYAAKNFAHRFNMSENDTQVMDLLYRLLDNKDALKVCYTVAAPLASILDTTDFAARKRRKRGPDFTAPIPSVLFLATLWDLPTLIIERLLKDTSIPSLNLIFDIGDEADLGIPRTSIEAAAYKGNY
jgi:hypothetical protein